MALANEDSLYEMNPIGPKIEKCNKGKALSILTAGVPTLSISFEGEDRYLLRVKQMRGFMNLSINYTKELSDRRDH